MAGNNGGRSPDFQAGYRSTVVQNSLIGDTRGSGIRATAGTGNILDQPALLGPLADNGGPTLTHALLPDSPAINAGSNSLALDSEGNPLSTDQRGSGFDRINVGTIDIGAFESDLDGPATAPLVLTATIDEGGVLRRPDLLNTLSVVFSSDVAITAETLSLFNDSEGGVEVDLNGIGFNYDASTNTATWDFSTLDPLEAAFYTWQLDASSITSEGLALDGNGDGANGDNFVSQHYVAIPGDANLDGAVNALDETIVLLDNLGTTSGAVWADGDFNGDGQVNELGDAIVLARNLDRDVRPENAGESFVIDVTRDEGGVLARPDQLNTIAVTYDRDVNVNAQDLFIRNDTLNTTIDTSTVGFSYNSSTFVATWDFSELELDPAFYTFVISGSVEATGDGLAIEGGFHTEVVYVAIPGDTQLDGRVDVLADAFNLIGNLRTTSGAVYADGDFNSDGQVDILGDAFILIGNLDRDVRPPVTAQALATAHDLRDDVFGSDF